MLKHNKKTLKYCDMMFRESLESPDVKYHSWPTCRVGPAGLADADPSGWPVHKGYE